MAYTLKNLFDLANDGNEHDLEDWERAIFADRENDRTDFGRLAAGDHPDHLSQGDLRALGV